MEPEAFNPNREVENLAKEHKDAIADNEVTEQEQQKLSQLSENIQNAIKPLEDESKQDTQKREDALRLAITEVANESGVSYVELYALIWPEQRESTFQVIQHIRSPMDVKQRKVAMDEFLTSSLPGFEKGLEKCSTETGVLFTNSGVVTYPSRIVFTNSYAGENTTPVRIDIDHVDWVNLKNPEQLAKLLTEEYNEQHADYNPDRTDEDRLSLPSNAKSVTKPKMDPNDRKGEQMKLWQQGIEFDIPKDKTAIFILIAPGRLKGTEEDFIDTITDVYQKRYGATVYAVHAESISDWEAVAKQNGASDLPATKNAQSKTVLDSFDKSYKQAIADKKEMFIFHYMAHGGGGVAASARASIEDEGVIRLENDEGVDVTDFAKLMAQKVNGEALSSKIRTGFIQESCYSGAQLDNIRTHLKDGNIPTKDLFIMSEGNRTLTDGSFTTEEASVINEAKRGQVGGGAFAYHLHEYYQEIDRLKSSGAIIKPPVGTYAHAMQHADLMSQRDKFQRQNARGYRYSTESNIDNFFSSLQHPSAEDIA